MKGKDKLNADMTNACAEQPHVEIINHLNIFDVSPLHHFFGAHPCVKYHCTIFLVEIKEVAAWWWERRVVKKQPCLYDFVSLPILHPRKT